MKILWIILTLALHFRMFASHIVGGELVYDYIGKNGAGQDIYRITLKVYRDCGPNNAQFDGLNESKAIITVRETNGVLTGTFDIGLPVVIKVPSSINNPCIQTPSDVCVEEGIYVMTLELFPKAGGYYVTYQRCCRNNSISNLVTPGKQGATYFTRIPGPEDAPGNSSPRFKTFPPLYLCDNYNFIFDHSASDPDGDVLEYSLYEPHNGIEDCCAFIGSAVNGTNCANPPVSCPDAAPPPPYPPVNYFTPFSAVYPISANPAFAINSVSGIITGRPDLTGQYVVGVCVKEYRGAKLINTHFRDFQFNVKTCIVQLVSEIKDQENRCQGSIVSFSNLSRSSFGPFPVLWDFGVAGTGKDTSVLFEPTFTYPDTGKYVVTLVANPYHTCSDTSKKIFYVYPELEVAIPSLQVQCLKGNSFDFSVTGKYAGITRFSWDFSAEATPSVSNSTNPQHIVYARDGIFPVSLIAYHGPCYDTAAGNSWVIGKPLVPAIDRDTTIIVGQTIPINIYGGTGFTYTWAPVTEYLNCSPCNMPDPVVMPTGDIAYTVSVEDPYHCFIVDDKFRIRVLFRASLDLPTAFTPNGDGINDVICVGGWGLKKLLYFRVFNRWGQMLFESHDLKQGWDGKYNGVLQGIETYIYQVSVETYIDDKPLSKTGSFKLIR